MDDRLVVDDDGGHSVLPWGPEGCGGTLAALGRGIEEDPAWASVAAGEGAYGEAGVDDTGGCAEVAEAVCGVPDLPPGRQLSKAAGFDQAPLEGAPAFPG